MKERRSMGKERVDLGGFEKKGGSMKMMRFGCIEG